MSKVEGLNRVGRCITCEKEIYNIKKVHPLGHPYAGEATAIGEALPDARQITMILADGHQCCVTMCEGCAALPIEFSSLWKKVLNTWALEISDEFKIINNIILPTPEQRATQKAQLRKQVFNIPVGVINIKKVGK